MRILDPVVRPTSPTENIYRDSSIGVAKCTTCDDPGAHIAYQFPDGRILRFNGQWEEECSVTRRSAIYVPEVAMKALLLSVSLFLMAGAAVAGDTRHTDGLTPDALIWKDNPAFPKGIQIAVLVGDPSLRQVRHAPADASPRRKSVSKGALPLAALSENRLR